MVEFGIQNWQNINNCNNFFKPIFTRLKSVSKFGNAVILFTQVDIFLPKKSVIHRKIQEFFLIL